MSTYILTNIRGEGNSGRERPFKSVAFEESSGMIFNSINVFSR